MHRNAVWRPAGDIFLFCSVVFRLAVGCMIILLCIFFGPLVYCVRRLLRKKPPDVETIFSNAMAGRETSGISVRGRMNSFGRSAARIGADGRARERAMAGTRPGLRRIVAKAGLAG